jgi:hypothetical protein
MEKAPTPKEIRVARSFLQKRGIRSGIIKPLDFLHASRELSATFIETLKLLASLLTQDQGQGQSPKARREMRNGIK